MQHLNCGIQIFLFICLLITEVFAQGGPAGQDSGANSQLDSISNGRTIAIDTTKDAPLGSGAIHDTLASANAKDSTHKQESESARMYQSAISIIRRDAFRPNDRPDSLAKQQRIKIAEPAIAAPSPQKRTDSISVIPNKNQPRSEPPVKLKKSSIILAVGSCALIGCGIAAYLIKNSKNDDIISQNNRIPPPPLPPVNLAPSP